MTKNGAYQLSENWIYSVSEHFPGGESQIITLIRGKAALGYVLSSAEDVDHIVSEFFGNIVNSNSYESHDGAMLINVAITAKATLDYVNKESDRSVGIDKLLSSYGDPNFHSEIYPFINVYLNQVLGEE